MALDRLCQRPGGLAPVSPSVFVRCQAQGDGPGTVEEDLFRCASCGSTALEEMEDGLVCETCGATFAVRDGVYDFREQVEGSGERLLTKK